MPFPVSPEITRVDVDVMPPIRSPAWENPVLLRFDVVRWRHDDAAAVAYVPALRIAVLAEDFGALDKSVVSHIRSFL